MLETCRELKWINTTKYMKKCVWLVINKNLWRDARSTKYKLKQVLGTEESVEINHTDFWLALSRCHSAEVGSCLPTFRDNPSVPSSRWHRDGSLKFRSIQFRLHSEATYAVINALLHYPPTYTQAYKTENFVLISHYLPRRIPCHNHWLGKVGLELPCSDFTEIF
jgi:hypothetical protein